MVEKYIQLSERTYLLNGEVGGRPLYLPLLIGNAGALLIDTGCASHVEKLIKPALGELKVEVDEIQWIVTTHCDIDHHGGNHAMKALCKNATLACGVADRAQVESPDVIFSERYDAYREYDLHYYDEGVKEWIMAELGEAQAVDKTFGGGEVIDLGDRKFEILHLPGHSKGHLGVYEKETNTLFAGDAIHGAVYNDLRGRAAMGPTYLDVDEYLKTIDTIEKMAPALFSGCHWPYMKGEAVLTFCKESRDFVVRAEQAIFDFICGSKNGAGLSELCDEVGPTLGSWPAAVNRELAYAFHGHLKRLLESGKIKEVETEMPWRCYTNVT